MTSTRAAALGGAGTQIPDDMSASGNLFQLLFCQLAFVFTDTHICLPVFFILFLRLKLQLGFKHWPCQRLISGQQSRRPVAINFFVAQITVHQKQPTKVLFQGGCIHFLKIFLRKTSLIYGFKNRSAPCGKN